jgi:hypothetical protein
VAGDFGYGSDRSARGAFAHVVSPFAGFLLLIVSLLDVLQGLSAVANDDLYAQGGDYLYEFDLTTWGWVHLVLGVLGVLVAVGILLRAGWALFTGIVVASLSVLTNFMFLPIYPAWSAFIIGFNVLVIWALSNELKSDQAGR